MYKKTSKNNQGRADRILPRGVGGEPEIVNVEERIEMLQEKLRRIDKELMNCTDKKTRKMLGRNKALLATELVGLRGKNKRKGLGIYFIESAKRILDQETYNKILLDVRHIYDIREKDNMRKATEQREREMEILKERL